MLEGESDQSLTRQLTFLHERALPDLGSNIKCGNSLIGPDLYESRLALDEDEKYRINAFDWKAEFSAIMQVGGFDAVIGNPPYGTMITPAQMNYFSTRYHHQDYQLDYYLLFLERYELLVKSNGLLGVIVSNTWLQSVTLRKVRQYLASQYQWLRILYLPEKIFRAVVDTHVLIFQKTANAASNTGDLSIDVRRGNNIMPWHTLPQKDIPRDGSSINIVAPIAAQQLLGRITGRSVPLKDIASVFNGVKPFEKGKGNPPQTEKIMEEKPYVREGAMPGEGWSPLLRGSLIQRYKTIWNHDYWIQYGPWLAAPRDPFIFEAPSKIMVRQTGDSLIATLVGQKFIARDNLHIVLPKDLQYDLRYILGIINSKLLDFVYTLINPEKGEALAQVKKYHVEQLPILPVNFDDPQQHACHDRMVALVEKMLTLQKQHAAAKTQHEKDNLQRQIDATDGQIDKLVYELYGLMEEEIKLVEGASVARMG